MCLYPKLILNPKYKANKKNGGNIPPVTDERVKYVPIGCQECMECRKQKARDWQVRLTEDIKCNTNAKFITLTFNNESYRQIMEEIQHDNEKNQIQTPMAYDLDNAICTMATRRFLERWRKKYKKSLRHWLVTELGGNGTENVHLHGIVWTNDIKEVDRIWNNGQDKNNKPMPYGWTWTGTYVNNKTVNYIVKYVNKVDVKHKKYKSIILTSPGIGDQWAKKQTGDWIKNKYQGNKTIETYRTQQGIKLALPIYYRNKIYQEEEKEKLWIEKIDKQTRYVLGNKISVKDGEQEYNNALKEAQKINKELGYGNNEKNWEQEQYERQQRLLKQQKRIASGGPPGAPRRGAV